MPWIICFTIPPTNIKICVPIPVLVDPFRKPGPPEWVTGLDKSLVKDLPILASIDALAADLSNASLRRTLQSAVQDGVKQPGQKGVTINFGKRE